MKRDIDSKIAQYKITRRLADMWDTMYAGNGVGLAANQIGANIRVAAVDTIRRPNSNRSLVMVNPEIVESKGSQTSAEGCLSMPGLRWNITRAEMVTVRFQDVAGKPRIWSYRGLTARCIQHECDHLAGRLCTWLAPCDKVSFHDGGRTEEVCGRTAESVCVECGKARCDECDSEGFEAVGGRLLCEDCVPNRKVLS